MLSLSNFCTCFDFTRLKVTFCNLFWNQILHIFIFHRIPDVKLLRVSLWHQTGAAWNESRMKLKWFKNNHLSIRRTLNIPEYKMFLCFVVSVCGCLSIHTEWRGVHTVVYTSQRLPITLIKFHTARGDSLCPDQIANISWLKYMFAKRLERKKISTGSENTQSDGWEKGFRE